MTTPRRRAEEITVLLGWDYYDACNEIDRADVPTLCELLSILEAPDTAETPHWVSRRASAAARYIRETVFVTRGF